ncbi:MAG TPA: YaaC family protein [Gemmatimonadales bacterium]|nr:YaaC family protein [Gemmatimonadales bacterium]
MKVRTIQTEEPRLEQWRLLSRYSYEPNIARFFGSRGATAPTPSLTEYIAGSIRQAEAYFVAATDAPLDIQPLLLYYGAANLLAGAGAMLAAGKLPIKNHGMTLQQSSSGGGRIADLEILPVSPTAGALQLFTNVFSPGTVFLSGVPWTLEEVLGSIPDLKEHFVECFPQARTYALAVELVRREELTFERIALDQFAPAPDPREPLERVPGISRAYIRPDFPGGRYVILRRKLGAAEIGSHSLSGGKWLHMAHEKGGKLVEPGQLVLMLMGLYALGHLSRYFPEQWNPFVRTDQTGERMVVERFLQITLRYVPNLVLNALSGERIQFVYPVSGEPSVEAPAGYEELKKLIRRECEAVLREKTV